MNKVKALLLLASITALTACGGGEPPVTSSQGGVPSVSSFVDESNDDVIRDTNGNIIFNNIKLKMWSVCTNPDGAYQDEIVTKFNQAYQGQINIETYHESRYSIFSNLAKTVTQDPDNAPDLFYGYGERIGALVSNKLFVPQDIYLEQANIGFDKSYFEPLLVNNCYIGSQLYGLPISVDSAMTYARKDILTKNGLPIPTTYDELMTTCDALVEKADAGELWVRGNDTPNVAPGNVYTWRKYNPEIEGQYYPFPVSPGDMWVNAYIGESAVSQNGGSITGSDGMPSFNNSGAEKGLQLLRDWLLPTATSKNKHALSKIDLNYDAGVTEFYSGCCAFYFAGAWDGYGNTAKIDSMYTAEGGSADNLAIMNPAKLFALDASQSSANTIFGDSHAISIVRTCKSRTERIAAAIFSNYLAENCGGVWTKAGHLPASLIVQQSSELYLNNEFFDKYVRYYGTTDQYRTMPVSIYYDYIIEGFQTALKKAMISSYKDTPVSTLLTQSYDDTMNRIKDLQDL
jgi:ABC-type sugar transport system, periplasmic component